MAYPRIRETLESSSAAVLQAVAAALSNAWYRPPQIGPALGATALRWAGRLPDKVIASLGARALRNTGLDPALAGELTTEGLARQALTAYERVEPGVGYPAIMLGAPNGGVAYLAALLRIPYLPAQFLLSFSHRSKADDIKSYQAYGASLIDTILQRNPDLHAINHYDPIHDRFLVVHLNHVRLKLRQLPQTFQQFIRAHLAPGGIIFFADCTYQWDQYLIAENHTFQVGGLGGYVSADYFEGNEEIDAWLESIGAEHRGGWTLSEHWPISEEPESEWGSLPEFKAAVQDFAANEEYQFKALSGGHPEDFSALAYTAYLWEADMHEHAPQGMLVECFNQINPTAALRANLLPLWLPFHTDDSLQYLARMAPYLPKDIPLLLSLVPSLLHTHDTPGALAWEEVASKAGPLNWIGVNPERYPIDIAARANYLPALQAWVNERQLPEPRPQMTPDDLLEMMAYLQRHGANLLPMLLEALPHLPPEEPPPDTSSDFDITEPEPEQV
ncbi:MAG: hypothetical protein GXP38_05180 [Chloroflexi bacterium]|nr:hypothetical protein [Chloroflexota bacterium]